MRVAVVSDLHFEIKGSAPLDLSPLAGAADLLLAAGDIGKGASRAAWLATSPIPALSVLGNHEFYFGDMPTVRREAVADLDCGIYEGRDDGAPFRVLGCTLWTDYDIYGRQQRNRHMDEAYRCMNDHRVIRPEWTPAMARERHLEERAWLKKQLERPVPADYKTIVMTHHMPTVRAVAPRFAGDPLTPAFCSNLEDLMPMVDLWAFGHTHSPWEGRVGRCLCVCNPRGYPDERAAEGLGPYEIRIVEV